jgi:hypothetical protein
LVKHDENGIAIHFEEIKAGQSDDGGSIKLSLSASVKVSLIVMQSNSTNARMHDVRVSIEVIKVIEIIEVIEVIDLNERITCLCLETQPFLFQEAHYQTVIHSVRMKTEWIHFSDDH